MPTGGKVEDGVARNGLCVLNLRDGDIIVLEEAAIDFGRSARGDVEVGAPFPRLADADAGVERSVGEVVLVRSLPRQVLGFFGEKPISTEVGCEGEAAGGKVFG